MRVDEKTTVETSLEDLGDMLEITFEKDSKQAASPIRPESVASSSYTSEAHETIAVANIDDVSGVESEKVSSPQVEGSNGEAQLLDFSFADVASPQPTPVIDIFSSMTLSPAHTPSTILNETATNITPEAPAVVTPVPPVPPTQSNKRLASNIQKFLQQSQQKN